MMTFSEFRVVVRHAATSWLDHEATSKAAALAYYGLLSFAPLLVLAVSLGSFVLGDAEARRRVSSELTSFVDPTAAHSITSILQEVRAPGQRWLGTIIGLLAALLGASGVFSELQLALNHVWGVHAGAGRGVRGFVRDRLFSVLLVLFVALLLLASLVVSTVLSALSQALPQGESSELLPTLFNTVVSLGMTAVLWGLVLRTVPDAKVAWRDVWMGAWIGSLLFTFGKSLLGYYLGTSSLASSYGGAGSLVALLVWVYYSAQLLLFAAELSRACAALRGDPIEPRRGAVVATASAGATPTATSVGLVPTAPGRPPQRLPEPPAHASS